MLSLQMSQCCLIDSQSSIRAARDVEVEFNLNHPYVPNEEDILNIINALKVFENIEDESKLSRVIVPNASFLKVQKAMAMPSTFLEQQQSNINELRSKLLCLEKSITLSSVQESQQTIVDVYLGH
jgi:hypothetical protein